jgi:hypothetical protein
MTVQWRLATVSAIARIDVKDEDRPTNRTGRHAECIEVAAIPAAGKRVLLMLIFRWGLLALSLS